jgi:hypothetical protein
VVDVLYGGAEQMRGWEDRRAAIHRGDARLEKRRVQLALMLRSNMEQQDI